MKKILSVAMIATGMFLQNTKVNAQEGFQLGVEGTPQLSWLVNKDDMDNANYETLPTFNAAFGLNSAYGFNENFGIGLNALYSFQGQRYKFIGIERVRKVEYIKIPLMFIYTGNINTNMMFIGKIGPQLGLLTNAKLCDADGNVIVSDQKTAYESMDWGAVINTGVGFMLAESWYLDVMLRFDYAFTDAEDNDYKLNINNPISNGNGNGVIITSDRASTYNTTAGLTIGLRYLFL